MPLRALRAPKSAANLIVDWTLAPRLARFLGVEVGDGCRFIGFPEVRRADSSQIRLGNRVLLNSRPGSNEAGISHRTILAATRPGSRICIGDDTAVSGVSIVAHRSVVIGKRVLLGAGACIWDTDFHPTAADARRLDATRGARSAPVLIGDDVFIGARALVLKGVSIGARALVGAGAVVTHHVPSDCTVVGNPAQVVRSGDPALRD